MQLIALSSPHRMANDCEQKDGEADFSLWIPNSLVKNGTTGMSTPCLVIRVCSSALLFVFQFCNVRSF